jgi:tetratricopeptide (TPR) repeat protein
MAKNALELMLHKLASCEKCETAGKQQAELMPTKRKKQRLTAPPAAIAPNSAAPSPLLSRKTVAALLVCLLLVVAVFIVYSQTVSFAFINLDDDDYVLKNPHLVGGFSAEGVAWAFSETRRAGHWHPLTWLSLMLDSELYGQHYPGGYHLTNITLHAAIAVVLFLLLLEMTRDIWPSALVAVAFAVHPTHVESVAWITERKDVLSGLFGLLSIWAYARYAAQPSIGRYLPVAIALALGLMAKPMLVTWPFLFLLLDYWPLKRRYSLNLLLEKLPLLLLVTASAGVTIIAQQLANGVVSLQTTSLAERVSRAAVLYWDYVCKTFWPMNLAVNSGYSAESSVNYWLALRAGVWLALVTAVALWGARRGLRWLAVGWFWFLGALLPTIGLVQVGVQVEADRFLYLPQIGLCIAVVWSAAYAVRRWLYHCDDGAANVRLVSATAGSLLVACLTICGWRQSAYWRDSLTLWTRTLQIAEGNWLVHFKFANALADDGRMDEAIEHYRRALATRPNFVDAQCDLGSALATRGRLDEAIASFRAALAINPNLPAVQGNIGLALLARGRTEDLEEAINLLRQELRADPNDAGIWNTIGEALLRAERYDEAIIQFQNALRINAGYAEAMKNLEVARAVRQSHSPAPPTSPSPSK